MGYKHILVAVDTTEEADEVLTAAEALAQQVGAELSALTVVRPLAGVYGGLDMAPISQGSLSFEQEAVDQTKEQLTALAGVHQIPAERIHVKLGVPAAEIRSAAEGLNADLIVIGTHGRHGLGLLLGSTANAVLHGVGCDVLAIKIHRQG